MDVCIGIKNLKNIDNFNSWVTRIAINKVNLSIKKKIEFRDKYYLTDNEPLINKELLSVNFEKNIIKNVILLYYFKEISVIENIPLDTVKSRLNSAKKLLKDIITNEIKIA